MSAVFDGDHEDYNGHKLYRFAFEDTEAIIVVPKEPLGSKAWLWKGFYFGAFPTFDFAMLDEGFYLAFVRSETLFPIPRTMAVRERFYEFMTKELNFPAKVTLFGLSRGAWYIYSWAAQNPDKVACIYADNPMCDFKSTYLGTGIGNGMPDKIPSLLEEFGYASFEEAAAAPSAGPVDELEPLAKAGVPIIHVAATEDQIVPYEENTALLAERYRDLGGEIKVIPHPGLHHPHGLEDPTPVVEFIKAHTDW